MIDVSHVRKVSHSMLKLKKVEPSNHCYATECDKS